MKVKKALSFLLVLTMVLGMLPGVSALRESRFVLVVESGGKLVIAPEYVSYADGDTIRQALLKTNHDFVGLEDGWILEIDGVGGNYSRSDQNGGYDLNTPASEITHFRFSEDLDSKPSTGLMTLMTAMADYAAKSADVRSAAKAEYDTAFSQFVGLDSASALLLAQELNAAVKSYEDALTGKHYGVTFTDAGTVCADMEITVQNPYGKVWTADRGRVELPAGDYTFCAIDGDTRAEGSFTVDSAESIVLTMPQTDLLKTDAFRLSGSYGSETNEENKFTDEEFSVGAWENRTATVSVFDSFNGTVYANVFYDESLTVLPTLTAIYTGANSGEEKAAVIPFESLTSGAADVLKNPEAPFYDVPADSYYNDPVMTGLKVRIWTPDGYIDSKDGKYLTYYEGTLDNLGERKINLKYQDAKTPIYVTVIEAPKPTETQPPAATVPPTTEAPPETTVPPITEAPPETTVPPTTEAPPETTVPPTTETPTEPTQAPTEPAEPQGKGNDGVTIAAIAGGSAVAVAGIGAYVFLKVKGLIK